MQQKDYISVWLGKAESGRLELYQMPSMTQITFSQPHLRSQLWLQQAGLIGFNLLNTHHVLSHLCPVSHFLSILGLL